jgi:hypothetical protein
MDPLEQSAIRDAEIDEELAEGYAEFLAKSGWHVILTKSLIGWNWTAYQDGMPRRWGWRLFSWNAEYAGRAAAHDYDRSRAAKARRLKWTHDTKV